MYFSKVTCISVKYNLSLLVKWCPIRFVAYYTDHIFYKDLEYRMQTWLKMTNDDDDYDCVVFSCWYAWNATKEQRNLVHIIVCMYYIFILPCNNVLQGEIGRLEGFFFIWFWVACINCKWSSRLQTRWSTR